MDTLHTLEGAGEEFELDVVVAQVLGGGQQFAAPRPRRFIPWTVTGNRW
ncbi:hypothetical protein [Streptomyces lancefieldiae]|uniref:Uncharacterized protein n=1 Tax=Streptomyces lancefieldiae TaxID=3075520 RepID=A0ABU3AYI4_9ACTN|nr:hypothetical protein [Streptomyces sp. DSM 40712]MDT0615233.1 hypothetical protein [Streptomyces sp. DSM 40712]